MRIAFLTSVVPDGRPTTGYEIANEAIVGGLKALGHDVCRIGFQLPRQGEPVGDAVVLSRANLENARAGRREKLGFLLRSFKTGLPVSAAKLTLVAQENVVAALEASGPFDCVIANSYQMAAAFPDALPADGFCYIAHNVEHVSARENAARAGSALQRRLYARDARLLEQIETGLVRRAAWVWTLSAEDATTLQVPPDKGAMLPLAVPDVEPISRTAEPAHDVGMIGTWTWQPNRVGLEWFCDAVVPLLDKNTTVAVAGAVPDGLVVPDRVQLLGRVDSAVGFLASVGVVPLVSRGGTGVQLKTIEALQAGLHCVATPSSVRGVADIPAYCTVTDNPSGFAAALDSRVASIRNKAKAPSDGAAADFGKAQYRAMLAALEDGLRHQTDKA